MEYNITYGPLVDDPVVVTLAVAKRNSGIEVSYVDDDELLQILLDSAVEDAENFIETPIQQRSLVVGLSEWPSTFVMPVYPVAGVTEVTYKDSEGSTQTVSVSDYVLYEVEGRHKIKFTWDNWPVLWDGSEFPISINCSAGYTTEKVPAAMKSAVLMRFSHKERFREDVPTSYNRAFHAALRPFKLWK